MSNLEAKKIAPATGTTVTLGAAGDAVTVAATALKTNTIKDAGGNTIFTSDGSGTLSSVNGALKGGLKFISTQTFSNVASVAFTSGIDSTYNEYMFVFSEIHPDTDNNIWWFQASTDGGSTYGVTCTTTLFAAVHDEDGDPYGLAYAAGDDRANSTSYIYLAAGGVGGAADECLAGTLNLFNLSSTTYVKNFYARTNNYYVSNYSKDTYVGGYFDTTSAINAFQFQMGGGGTVDGTISLYGTGY